VNRELPKFEEINMSCEIGAYQGDDAGEPLPPFVTGASDRDA
jgi:hypothetical protein